MNRSIYKSKVEILFISGPVGVGKTTFSRKLLHFLFLNGCKAYYTFLVAFPLISYVFFKLTAIFFYGQRTVKMHETINVHPSTLFKLRISKVPRPVAMIIVLLELLSITASFYIKIWLHYKNKKIIIVDEGIINMVANYLEIFDQNFFLVSYIIIFAKKLQRRFNLKIIHLDVNDEEELLKRWNNRGFPQPTVLIGLDHHLGYTKLIRVAKSLISKMFPVILIDTTGKSPDEVFIEFKERGFLHCGMTQS